MTRTTYAKTPGNPVRVFTRPSWPVSKVLQEDLNTNFKN